MSDFERQLRARLVDAAQATPAFSGFDPDAPLGRSRAGGTARVPGPRGPRVRRWLAVAAAAVVVGLAVATVSWWSVTHGNGGTPPAASCVSVLRYGGRVYAPAGGLVRVPRPGPRLGTAVRPACDDGTGRPSRSEHRTAFTLPGVSPDRAILADGDVWLWTGLTEQPSEIRKLTRPVRCIGSGPTKVAGTLMAVNGTRFQRDFRPEVPYTAVFAADDGTTLPLTTYSSVRIQMQVTSATTGGRDHDLIRAALSEGHRLSATVRCDGRRFDVVSWRLAR